jgi:hypothetical protein
MLIKPLGEFRLSILISFFSLINHPPVRAISGTSDTENSRRSVFCSGLLDLSTQAEIASARRPNTPTEVRVTAFGAQVERTSTFSLRENAIVGRNCFGHCPGRTADREESSGHFLAGADLGERSVRKRIEVELQRLLRGTGSSVIHGMSPRESNKHHLVQSAAM